MGNRAEISTRRSRALVDWVKAGDFEDILYEKAEGVAKITINRPEKRNAFRAKTFAEMSQAFLDAWGDRNVGVVILTGAGDRAFCAGGDVSARGAAGYGGEEQGMALGFSIPTPYELIRRIPKVVIAMVNGYAIGGGHVLHVICDLSIASETAMFGQVGPRFGSFDAGFGSAYLARVVGQKKAREIWFLCRRYSAQEALEMGLVNKVVPPDKLEEETMAWCREILQLSPTALRVLKSSFDADVENITGIESMAVHSLLMYYGSEEAAEGGKAFLEKRPADYSKWR
jgi:naphthoate synthase